jgi:hypothetical protein
MIFIYALLKGADTKSLWDALWFSTMVVSMPMMKSDRQARDAEHRDFSEHRMAMLVDIHNRSLDVSTEMVSRDMANKDDTEDHYQATTLS